MIFFKGLRVFLQPDTLTSGDTSKEAEATEKVEATEVVKEEENVGGQPIETKPWMAQLPKELQGSEELKGFNTIGELAKAYLTKGEVKQEDNSKSFLEKLTTEENKEDWDKFRAEILTDKATEEEKKGLENYIEFTKKAKLNSTQAKDLLEASKEVAKAQREENQRAKEERERQAPKLCEEFLKKTWGEQYEKNTKQAQKGYNKLFKEGEEFTKSFNNSKYTNDPLIMELLNRVGSLFAEPSDAFKGGAEHSKKENGWGIAERFYK